MAEDVAMDADDSLGDIVVGDVDVDASCADVDAAAASASEAAAAEAEAAVGAASSSSSSSSYACSVPPHSYDPTLHSVGPYALTYFLISLVLLCKVLLLASAGSGLPRSHLGRRPPGKGGVWTYLAGWIFNKSASSSASEKQEGKKTTQRGGVGVWGYDSSLGALSPPLRIACHACAILFLSSINLLIVSAFGPARVAGGNPEGAVVDEPCEYDPAETLYGAHERLAHETARDALVVTALLYLVAIKAVWTYWPGVSDPGGPRSAKIRRSPRWDDVTTDAGEMCEDERGVEWRCEVAETSHDVTLERFGLKKKGAKKGVDKEKEKGVEGEGGSSGLGMTGEPSGRQMWTWSTSHFHSHGGGGVDDEELIQDMASGGRHYHGFNPSRNPNSCDRIFRAQMIRGYLDGGGSLPDMHIEPKTATEAARKAVHFYSMLQTEDGHWAGDYGGPHFLMPGLIVAWYVMGKPKEMLDDEQVAMMSRYLTVHQQADGGWGTHIESPSTMFGTVLCYVALRLMGADPESTTMKQGRAFVRFHGGAVMTSSWAKFWLCLLGAMEWEGHNSVPPEMWLLPNWVPFHPGRLWCHCRMVYLPMGYLYGSRFVYDKAVTDPLIKQLREELYADPYDSIPWSSTRHLVADMDNYSPIPRTMAFLQNCLALYESWSVFRPLRNFVRHAGLDFCLEYMRAEDLQTNYIDIGPVNKALNLLSAYHASGGDVTNPAVRNHMMRVPDYLWVAEDGMKMQGYNGSQCWDTSFAIQAVAEAGLLDAFPDLSKKVWRYLERTQILSTEVSKSSPAYTYESADSRDRYYRHVSEGGWPFSTSAHGWPISDCTGEGLKAALVLSERSDTIKSGLKDGTLLPIGRDRLSDAINVILTLQNEDGGWATYENNRGFGWYEALNPSEVFGDIMIDYSYVECSMASLTALADFRDAFPNHGRIDEIDDSISKGREFMKSIQRDDGSWYGSWACCFCYGCWFGVEGLVRAGEPTDSDAMRRCVSFLLSHQRPNGGWGEDFKSCYDKDYAADGMKAYGDEGSGVVNTAWALLALSAAECKDVDAVRRGVRYLMRRQLSCGDWPQEGIAGVFNRACGITYTAYRNVFPIWALGRCSEVYGKALDEKE